MSAARCQLRRWRRRHTPSQLVGHLGNHTDRMRRTREIAANSVVVRPHTNEVSGGDSGSMLPGYHPRRCMQFSFFLQPVIHSIDLGRAAARLHASVCMPPARRPLYIQI